MKSTRTELYVGQTLHLTVRVAAVGPFRQPPERPQLDDIPRFKERFKIDWANKGRPAESAKPDRILSDRCSWEFDYRLRPLNARVERIPPLPFVWYRPNRHPQLRGSFLTTYDDGIDIKVKPIPEDSAVKKPQRPIQVPEHFFQLAEGPEVLRPDSVFQLPSFSMLVLFVLVPPTVGAAWYVVWRRMYPDAARLALRRQSRAALLAYRALEGLGAVNGRERVDRVTTIAVNYLRQRLDLSSVEPTPAEVADHLQRAGASAAAIRQAGDFFRNCDLARFAPPAEMSAQYNLAEAAQHLVTVLEAEPWSPSS